MATTNMRERNTKKRAATQANTAKSKSSARNAAKTTPGGHTLLASRADFGAPIEGLFAKQPPELRATAHARKAV
jgi:hypothetical protein